MIQISAYTQKQTNKQIANITMELLCTNTINYTKNKKASTRKARKVNIQRGCLDHSLRWHRNSTASTSDGITLSEESLSPSL